MGNVFEFSLPWLGVGPCHFDTAEYFVDGKKLGTAVFICNYRVPSSLRTSKEKSCRILLNFEVSRPLCGPSRSIAFFGTGAPPPGFPVPCICLQVKPNLYLA